MKRKESRSGIEPRSFRLPAYRLTARPNRLSIWKWGKRKVIYLSLHCHHQNDTCIKMGSGESHFNVSLIVRDKVTRQCPQTTTLCTVNHGPIYIQVHAVSRFGLAVRRHAGKQKGRFGSIPLRLSLLFKKVVVCGHCLVTLSLTINEAFKWLSSLPILMQEPFWW